MATFTIDRETSTGTFERHARELFQQPGVAETVAWDQIKEHYYTTHDMLNPKRLIPAGPLGVDWSQPHGR
jgi:glutathionyl-hydroquinone reductase